MKQNGTTSSTVENDTILLEDELGENHIGTSLETPIRPDAFDLSDTEKIAIISEHFREIMLTLGLNLKDDSLNGTPSRVA